HGLRAADARDELHRQRVDLGRRQRIDGGAVAVRLEQRDEARARLHRGDLGRGRAAHLDDEVGAGDGAVGGDLGAGRGIEFVRIGRRSPCAALKRHLVAKTDDLLHRLRRGGDAGLPGGALLKDGDLHRPQPIMLLSAGMMMPPSARMTQSATWTAQNTPESRKTRPSATPRITTTARPVHQPRPMAKASVSKAMAWASSPPTQTVAIRKPWKVSLWSWMSMCPRASLCAMSPISQNSSGGV